MKCSKGPECSRGLATVAAAATRLSANTFNATNVHPDVAAALTGWIGNQAETSLPQELYNSLQLHSNKNVLNNFYHLLRNPAHP